MNIYLAARYSRRLELCQYREELQLLGFKVQARWLDGSHQIGNDGTPIGDSGEALVENESSEGAAALREKFAKEDFVDVCSAGMVVSFTEPPRSGHSRGGRHVEFGIALARSCTLIVVGHRENIFHWLPDVIFFETWRDAQKWIWSKYGGNP